MQPRREQPLGAWRHLQRGRFGSAGLPQSRRRVRGPGRSRTTGRGAAAAATRSAAGAHRRRVPEAACRAPHRPGSLRCGWRCGRCCRRERHGRPASARPAGRPRWCPAARSTRHCVCPPPAAWPARVLLRWAAARRGHARWADRARHRPAARWPTRRPLCRRCGGNHRRPRGRGRWPSHSRCPGAAPDCCW